MAFRHEPTGPYRRPSTTVGDALAAQLHQALREEERALVQRLRGGLREAAVDEDAAPMAAYMKSDQRFWGTKRPARDGLVREAKRTLGRTPNPDSLHAVAVALFDGDDDDDDVQTTGAPRREDEYLALELCRAYPRVREGRFLPLYERWVRQTRWWDRVDLIASHLVGPLVLDEPERTEAVLDRWIVDEDLWVRRTALLSRLRHKERTRGPRLLAHCRLRLGDRTFFIDKAIGWALREYAKTDARAVLAFVDEHKADMAPLAMREATKHLR